MEFEEFKAKVLTIAKRAGVSKVGFLTDAGSHKARFPADCDVREILGNTISPSVLVRWGSGHTARAAI